MRAKSRSTPSRHKATRATRETKRKRLPPGRSPRDPAVNGTDIPWKNWGEIEVRQNFRGALGSARSTLEGYISSQQKTDRWLYGFIAECFSIARALQASAVLWNRFTVEMETRGLEIPANGKRHAHKWFMLSRHDNPHDRNLRRNSSKWMITVKHLYDNGADANEAYNYLLKTGVAKAASANAKGKRTATAAQAISAQATRSISKLSSKPVALPDDDSPEMAAMNASFGQAAQRHTSLPPSTTIVMLGRTGTTPETFELLKMSIVKDDDLVATFISAIS